MSNIKFSDKVLSILKVEGIGQIEALGMVEHSAISSVGGCNRRFHDWLFLIRDNQVLEMKSFELKRKGHPYQGAESMIEECDECEGLGCKACGWRGEVKRWL